MNSALNAAASRPSCQDCKYEFASVQAARKAFFGLDGCPRCGSSRIDPGGPIGNSEVPKPTSAPRNPVVGPLFDAPFARIAVRMGIAQMRHVVRHGDGSEEAVPTVTYEDCDGVVIDGAPVYFESAGQ